LEETVVGFVTNETPATGEILRGEITEEEGEEKIIFEETI
jgi:hypothetical protein